MKTSIYAAMTAAAMLAGLLTANDMSAGTVTAGNTGTGNAPAAVEKQEEGKVILLSEDEYKAMVEDFTTEEWKYLGDRPAIVDFYADWCGPCRQMSPVLEKIASDYKGKINVYKVNVDKEQELAALFGATSIPLFVLIPKQGAPQLVKGAAGKEVFVKAIEDFLLK